MGVASFAEGRGRTFATISEVFSLAAWRSCADAQSTRAVLEGNLNAFGLPFSSRATNGTLAYSTLPHCQEQRGVSSVSRVNRHDLRDAATAGVASRVSAGRGSRQSPAS